MSFGLSDILTAVQQGVVAVSDLGKQTNGSLLNISGQLSTLSSRKTVGLRFDARDMTLASGNVSYPGIGFTPSFIIFFGVHSANQEATFGVDDLVSPRCYFNVTTTGAWATPGGASMFFSGDAGVTSQAAKVASFNSDGFTLTWTKTGAPAAANGFFNSICFR